MTQKIEPTRDASFWTDDNGKPHFKSSLSPNAVKVRAECKVPVHYPGIIIFVHGVNSTGEWFANAEKAICEGLNIRLGLSDPCYELKPNIYNSDNPLDLENYKKDRNLLNAADARSPVIRFFWGYRSPDGEEEKYRIPLVNRANEDYLALKESGMTAEELSKKGPWFWGGGPFQNGTTHLFSLWSDVGFDENLFWDVKLQAFAPDFDRLLTSAPGRRYYSHAAKRLADLLDFIRDNYPRDTVSVISHSQGTMIALAATAMAKQAPDSLFILNSPYRLNDQTTDRGAMPTEERLTSEARQKTLSAIIDKVAERAKSFSPENYNSLCVGQSQEHKSWKPDIKHKSEQLQTITHYSESGKDYPKVTAQQSTTEKWISERDNHGRFYIYFNPHDRVMGSLPLQSLGWQGLPNSFRENKPHPFFLKHQGHLFQRMMARSTSCGAEPNPQTAFSPLPGGETFWDDNGDALTYHNPPEKITVNINGEEVPEPILALDMVDFDKRRKAGGKYDQHPNSKFGSGWGQFQVIKNENQEPVVVPNDDTFDNYIRLYPKISIPTGRYRTFGYFPYSEKETRMETDEERRIRVGAYISQPTDHSTLPNSPDFMSRVVAYDLPVGFCDATWDKAFMAKLRDMADWTKGYDSYFESGVLPEVKIPSIISTETIIEVEQAQEEARKAYMEPTRQKLLDAFDKNNHLDSETRYRLGINDSSPAGKKQG